MVAELVWSRRPTVFYYGFSTVNNAAVVVLRVLDYCSDLWTLEFSKFSNSTTIQLLRVKLFLKGGECYIEVVSI